MAGDRSAMTARKKNTNEIRETEAPEVQAADSHDVAEPARGGAEPAQDVAEPAKGFGRAARQDETADDLASQAAESLGGFRYEGGYPIVGVGASAGGLEALEAFFDHVPPDCGMALVVVQHLSLIHI